MNMYQVVRTVDGIVINDGFNTRQEAKVKRNSYNISSMHIPKPDRPFCFVGRGSDHPKGPSFGEIHKNKRWL